MTKSLKPQEMTFDHIASGKDPTLLSALIGKLIRTYQPVAVQRNSTFLDEVPKNILLQADEKKIAAFLGSAFYLTARCSKDTCIKISAGEFSDILWIQIKDSNTFNSYALLSKMQHLQKLARTMGGSLDVTRIRSKETTIIFSIANKKNNESPYHNHIVFNAFE
jgi:hypothetical protein